MAQKPSIPKGTRDFTPVEMERRNYIFDTIKDVFNLFGFRQIETPAMENLSTLMGKYGEEGDKLLFKILNSGDFLRGADLALAEQGNYTRLTTQIAEKGLRYDLTVPFARFVVQHRNELQMPFKRYQIQPVWRADRPQKGRYREFYQCDADVVGTDSLTCEVELIQMIDEVFRRLRIPVAIKLNNRKVLAGIAEVIGEPDRLTDITVAIDKIDKIGMENVCAELAERGVPADAVERLKPFLAMTGTPAELLDRLSELLAESQTGMKGIAELRTIFEATDAIGLDAPLELDVSLARGLNYYTGAILEVKATTYPIGSISGGGRYDNLTGVFGVSGLSGVGISFGADRIYDVLNGLDLYPDTASGRIDVLFVNFGEKEALASLRAIKSLRAAGLSAELYPDASKMKKQMGYADWLGARYVAIIGESELAEGTATLKNMATGEQKSVPLAELAEAVRAGK
ncbi:MAG: histidine--tRNA ligase [Clostridium sp.]|nr:histidine--tRNA ligase [Clostridium sp.]